MPFTRVKIILNTAMTNSVRSGADLQSAHSDDVPAPATFPQLQGNFTRDDLVNGKAFNYDLIQASVIGPPTGRAVDQGANANIVRALRGTLPHIPQMPFEGPYIADAQIQEIVDWINAGCLDD